MPAFLFLTCTVSACTCTGLPPPATSCHRLDFLLLQRFLCHLYHCRSCLLLAFPATVLFVSIPFTVLPFWFVPAFLHRSCLPLRSTFAPFSGFSTVSFCTSFWHGLLDSTTPPVAAAVLPAAVLPAAGSAYLLPCLPFVGSAACNNCQFVCWITPACRYGTFYSACHRSTACLSPLSAAPLPFYWFCLLPPYRTCTAPAPAWVLVTCHGFCCTAVLPAGSFSGPAVLVYLLCTVLLVRFVLCASACLRLPAYLSAVLCAVSATMGLPGCRLPGSAQPRRRMPVVFLPALPRLPHGITAAFLPFCLPTCLLPACLRSCLPAVLPATACSAGSLPVTVLCLLAALYRLRACAYGWFVSLPRLPLPRNRFLPDTTAPFIPVHWTAPVLLPAYLPAATTCRHFFLWFPGLPTACCAPPAVLPYSLPGLPAACYLHTCWLPSPAHRTCYWDSCRRIVLLRLAPPPTFHCFLHLHSHLHLRLDYRTTVAAFTTCTTVSTCTVFTAPACRSTACTNRFWRSGYTCTALSGSRILLPGSGWISATDRGLPATYLLPALHRAGCVSHVSILSPAFCHTVTIPAVAADFLRFMPRSAGSDSALHRSAPAPAWIRRLRFHRSNKPPPACHTFTAYNLPAHLDTTCRYWIFHLLFLRTTCRFTFSGFCITYGLLVSTCTIFWFLYRVRSAWSGCGVPGSARHLPDYCLFTVLHRSGFYRSWTPRTVRFFSFFG